MKCKKYFKFCEKFAFFFFLLPSDGSGFGRYCLTNDFVNIFEIEVTNKVRLLGQFVARNFVDFKKLKSLEPKASSTTGCSDFNYKVNRIDNHVNVN